MSTTIVTTSRSPHGNTRSIAEAIGAELGAEIHEPGTSAAVSLAASDLVGFGSGIYWMGFRGLLREFVDALPEVDDKDAFLFATSGFPEPPLVRYMDRMVSRIEAKGFRVVGAFHCRGIDTMGPFGLIGGVNTGQPDTADLESAREFARQLAASRG
ncbi:flavodoxin family protein [Dietzia sp.]|uniref:flavodoxin family protein n=1 Tax=Dietzia sp. TaxID=1871616 RepID=UPI002FDB6F2C